MRNNQAKLSQNKPYNKSQRPKCQKLELRPNKFQNNIWTVQTIKRKYNATPQKKIITRRLLRDSDLMCI